MPHSKDHEGFQGEGVSAVLGRALEEGDQTEAGREEYKVWDRLREGPGEVCSEARSPVLSLGALPRLPCLSFPKFQGVPHFS